ncbi:MAG: alpha/beta fold hydrolase, partial [Myxococcota bacterium]|nr:alpha/beta fold hydrolase [Myxococcota bacterium]
MFYVGLLVIGCCALAFSAGIHLWFWRQYYADAQPRYDEQHFARTRDAYRLALWRYRPPNAGLAQVVVLCHGAFSNSRIFDLCPQASLAKYLRDQGFDVWLIDLREIGGSRRRGFLKRVPATVMDHLREDIPAALEYVCGETGNPAVHWVGHSMGGLLALLYAQSEGARRLRSITTLGTPAFLDPNPSLRVNSSLLRLMGALLLPWIRLIAHAAAPLYVGMRVHLFAINAANIEPFVVRL